MTGNGGFIIKHNREEFDVSILEMKMTTSRADELRISVVDMDDQVKEIVITVRDACDQMITMKYGVIE